MSDDARPVAVVTGGARGIGEAIVGELVAAGYRTAVVDVNAKAIARAAETDVAQQRLLIPLHLSITDRDAVQAAMTRLAAEHGPIRALINNAG